MFQYSMMKLGCFGLFWPMPRRNLRFSRWMVIENVWFPFICTTIIRGLCGVSFLHFLPILWVCWVAVSYLGQVFMFFHSFWLDFKLPLSRTDELIMKTLVAAMVLINAKKTRAKFKSTEQHRVRPQLSVGNAECLSGSERYGKEWQWWH